MQDEARRAAHDALVDADAQIARRECLRRLVGGLSWAGELLRLIGSVFGPGAAEDAGPRDRRLVGMGYVASTCGELLRGTVQATDDGNAYAAATLLRQVVETEYLAWAFAEDRAEAAVWLESTREERLKRWQPKHLRERSHDLFRGKDYGVHCERGGHPTPSGCRALLNGPTDVNCAGLVADSLVHGSSTWRYLVAASDLDDVEQGRDPGSLLPFDGRAEVHHAVGSWWRHDPFTPYIIAGCPPVARPSNS